MAFTIELGWWLVPVGATIAAFICAYALSPKRKPPTGLGSLGDGVVDLVLFGAATILSLTAWLIWAVLI